MSNSRLHDIENQINDVKNIATQNIEKAIKRGENLDHLMDKSVHLEESANLFQRNSKQVKKEMRCKYYKRTALIALIVIIIISLLIWAISS